MHNILFKTKKPVNEKIIKEFFEVKFIQYTANKIIIILNYILFLQIILSINRILKISDTTIDILLKKKIFNNLCKCIVKFNIIVFKLFFNLILKLYYSLYKNIKIII